MLPFLSKRGQRGSRESCILLENGPTCRSLIPRALQCSSLAVRKFHTASEKCCGQGYGRCVQTLLPNVVAPETLITATVCVSSNCESPRKNFAWWVVTWKTLKNHRTAKIEGWALARGWALAQDNTVICFLKNCHHGNTIFISLRLVMKTEFKGR